MFSEIECFIGENRAFAALAFAFLDLYLLNVKTVVLKGPFSRLDFQLDRRGSRRPVVTQYKVSEN